MIQVIYNGIALETLGDVSVGGPSRSFEPAEAPQRIVNTLRITVDLFSPTYLQGQDKVVSIIAALKKQHAVLQWGDKGPPVVNFVNQTVTLREAELPEDPNAWGTYHRRVVLVVTWVEPLSDLEAENVGVANVATFQGVGSTVTTKIALPNIVTWQESMRTGWLHDRLAVRDKSEGRVVVSGFIQAVTTETLEKRRSFLLAKRKDLFSAMDGQEGTLERKHENSEHDEVGFSQSVRIEDLSVEINQASSHISYSFTARFTKWPPGNDDSTERFTVSEQTKREDGQVVVSFRGAIQANSYLHAKARLDVLRTTVQATFDEGAVIRVLSSDLDVAYISGKDAPIGPPAGLTGAFTELNFNESWLVFATRTRELSLRYAIRRRRDLLAGKESVEISGELFGTSAILSAAAAYAPANFLDLFFLAKNWGPMEREEREISYEGASAWASGTLNLSATTEVHREQRVSFSASFDVRLPDEDVILECDVSEALTYSAVRWVEHRRPDGASMFQPCGTESASRQVSGSVRSTRRATCEAFAAKKRKLLDVRKEGAVANTSFEDAPSITIRYEWLPRLTPPAGVVDSTREGGATTVDVAVYTLDFRYQERIPDLQLPPV